MVWLYRAHPAPAKPIPLQTSFATIWQTGKRVLVTSKGEAALSVLRDHIPEGIRELTISLLTSERGRIKTT